MAETPYTEYIRIPNENISVCICEGRHAAPHDHDYLELAYVIQGRAEHRIGNQVRMIETGDYLIVDYNTVHSYVGVGDTTFSVINVLFRPRLLDNSLTYCRSFRALLSHYLIKIDAGLLSINPSNHIFHDDDGKIRAYLQILLTEYREKRIGFTEMMRSTLVSLLIDTVRKISIGADRQDVIAYLTDYVARNYASPISLSAVAKECGYSLPYLSARFKREVGCGFQEYLIRVRMEEACRLLANTDRKILDICADVGYTDTNFFYVTFRRVTGKSPGEFRRETRG